MSLDAPFPKARWHARGIVAGLVLILCLMIGGLAAWAGLSETLEFAGPAWVVNPRLAAIKLNLARQALAKAQTAEAARLARAVIALQPYDLEAMQVLAQTYPNTSASKRAIVAQIGKLSLRDTYSQAWLMDDDFSRAQDEGGVFHADALLRRGAIPAPIIYFSMVNVMSGQAGQAAIANRLHTSPPWRAGFFRAMAASARPNDSISLLQRLGSLGDIPEGTEIGPLVSRLLDDARYSDLEWYATAFLSGASGVRPIVYDGGFDALTGPAPLNWEAQNIAGGAAIWRPNETQRIGVLDLTHDLFSSSGPLIRQLIFLRPGNYNMSAQVMPVGVVGSGRFRLGIDCVDGRSVTSVPLGGNKNIWSRAHQSFASLGADCPAYWLTIRPIPGDFAQSAEILVDNIKIEAGALG